LFFIISYDIKDDKKRTQVCNILKDFGNHVQYSVFECELQEKEYNKMLSKVLPLIDESKDSLRIYILCESCKKKIKVYGVNKISEEDILIF
jgi:CRISPR-associated protein Cas2